MTDLATARAAERPEEADGPEPAGPDERERSEPAPASAGGVELGRLLALARLSAPQALELGAAVVAAVVQRLGPEAGRGGDRVALGQVRVGADGRVLLDRARDDGSSGSAPALGSAVAAVLADVAGAARFRGRRPDPAADRLLAALDRARTDLPDMGVPVVAESLAEVVASIDRDAVRTELAALVRAVPKDAAAAGGGGTAGAPSTAASAGVSRPAAHREARRRGRRITAWLLSVLVLGAVVLVEVGLLRDKIGTDIGVLLDAGRSGATPSADSPPDDPAVRAPAPASAGSVTSVDLRPMAPCAPGAPCTLRLLVRLAPRADPQVVTWSYRVVDRCTGATATTPGGTVTVPPNGDRAVAVGTVALPDVPAVAVVAVTGLPAAAASAPVVAGSCRRTG